MKNELKFHREKYLVVNYTIENHLMMSRRKDS
jgi:hypothetical protein